ncbi:MAG: radical SAM protein [Desulfobacteraceae bacterium]|nr:radical SAM protein [Desulfobacteraceae bacterium]
MQLEQGPIRPPSEAGSLLLRFTRNCPWNKCTFCPVYKGREFSRRSLDEIRADIDSVRGILEDLHSLSVSLGFEGRVSSTVLHAALKRVRCDSTYQYVASWAAGGKRTVFIQDANSLLLPTDTIVDALRYLRKQVPGIRRITTYARSSTVARKSVEELRKMRDAGLDRIHIGLESGSDRVLEFVRKGTTADQHIQAGRKVIEAGMVLSEYYMPGLGGRERMREHALETARVLNAIDPHFIRLRSLRIPPRTPLHQDVLSGRFVPLTDDETVAEIRLMVESLEGIGSTLISDHIMNLLEEVEGKLPESREAMLAVIDRYRTLPPEEKLLFRLGRRGGGLRSFDDFNNPDMRRRLQFALSEFTSQPGVDIEALIKELADQYI